MIEEKKVVNKPTSGKYSYSIPTDEIQEQQNKKYVN